MTATAAASVPQHMTALEHANANRYARSDLRAEIANTRAEHGETAHHRSRDRLAQMLDAPPACVRNTRLDQVLGWAHRSGPHAARRYANAVVDVLYPDSAKVDGAWLATQLLLKPVGRLTARERCALGVVLRDRRPS